MARDQKRTPIPDKDAKFHVRKKLTLEALEKAERDELGLNKKPKEGPTRPIPLLSKSGKLRKDGQPRRARNSTFKQVDITELKELAEMQLSNAEIARWFGVHSDFVSMEPYNSIIDNARSNIKQRLARKAVQRAIEGDSDAVLIFALKSVNKWGVEDKTPVAAPIQSGFSIKLIDERTVVPEDQPLPEDDIEEVQEAQDE